MTNAPISLQDPRRSLYISRRRLNSLSLLGAVRPCLQAGNAARGLSDGESNNGAPGIDGVTFAAIEEGGVEGFLQQIQAKLVSNTYRPMPVRKKEIPKDGGNKVLVLSIPTIRDRVVQGALKLILEPIFETDFQPGSYGYRPKRQAHEAVYRVAQAVDQGKNRIIDLDLRAYFDTVQHSLLLEKVARRVQDAAVMRLLKMILTPASER